MTSATSPGPTYALAQVTACVLAGNARLTAVATAGARRLMMTESDVLSVVATLTLANFYKTMESTDVPGEWLDVYRPSYQGDKIYVKLKVTQDVQGGYLVVISFKEL